MTTISITFEIDPQNLTRLADSYLATLWHVAQANPAPSADKATGDLDEHLSREIVRRWLTTVHPDLWNRKGRRLGSRADGDESVPHTPPNPAAESGQDDQGEVTT